LIKLKLKKDRRKERFKTTLKSTKSNWIKMEISLFYKNKKMILILGESRGTYP
jgi:hypothetical protein